MMFAEILRRKFTVLLDVVSDTLLSNNGQFLTPSISSLVRRSFRAVIFNQLKTIVCTAHLYLQLPAPDMIATELVILEFRGIPKGGGGGAKDLIQEWF